MARKPVNKSAAIREKLAANPKASVPEIVQLLAADGIKSSPNLVYLVKGKLAGKARRKRVAVAVANGSPMELLREVHQVAQKAGGLAALRELVDMLTGQPVG